MYQNIVDELGICEYLKMVIEDFNSHSINWGYSESYLDREAVEASHLSLVHNAKLSKSGPD